MKFDQINIIAKVAQLMEARGTRKIKLGEILGIHPDASSQAKAERAHRFLNARQKSISIDEINALAHFFEKPLEFFMSTGKPNNTIAQTGKHYRAAKKK